MVIGNLQDILYPHFGDRIDLAIVKVSYDYTYFMIYHYKYAQIPLTILNISFIYVLIRLYKTDRKVR